MPQNLFAACRVNGALVAKRIRLDQAVQQQIEAIFNQQEAEFRDGITSEYRHRDRNQPYRPIYIRTVRALCAHDLMAWDGGAFDPEAAAVVTDRGLFVLRIGGYGQESLTPFRMAT